MNAIHTVALVGALSGIGAGAAAQLPHASNGEPPELNDATIAAIVEQVNTQTIATARIAAERADNDRIRELARAFMQEHAQIRQHVRDLAKRLGLTPTLPEDEDRTKQHAGAMDLLRSKAGAELNQAWLDHEIRDHEAVIQALSETLVLAIDNTELKALVESTIPTFRAHVDSMRALRAEVVS